MIDVIVSKSINIDNVKWRMVEKEKMDEKSILYN